MVHAKSDAEDIAVRPILDRDNVTLVCDAEVTRLETDPTGRTVTGVVVSRGGEQEVYTGDIVAVCASAVNSAKLLLKIGRASCRERVEITVVAVTVERK